VVCRRIFQSIVDSVDNQYDLIDNLYAFMSEGKADSIIMLKDSLLAHLEDTYFATADHIYNTLYDVGMFADSLGTRFDTILNSGEDFTFRIGDVQISYDTYGLPYFDTTEVAVIYDETFQSIWAAKEYLEEGVEYFGTGLYNIFYSESKVQAGLDTLMMAMQSFQTVCDTLNNYSLASFLDSSDLVDIGQGLKEAEDVLAGKTYFIKRWGDYGIIDSIEIKPVGIIENMYHGLYRTFTDMYWQDDPFTYTFRDIFPSGLPHDIIDQLQPDMVLNLQDSLQGIQNYFDRMEGVYLEGLFFDSTNVDAHTGVGYLKLFNMLKDVKLQGETIAALVDGGRIDSLFQNYDWNNLDYTDEIDDIRYHLFKQVDEFYYNDTTIIYTILIKDPNQSTNSYDIDSTDLVYPIYIIPQATEGILITSFIIENAITAMADGIEYVYTQVDSMIDITLDPNVLDLSNIEEPLDLIYALETSNPNFGTFTPQGKVMFSALGQNLAMGMQGLANLADTVVATMDYAELLMYEFGMDSLDYEYMMMDLYFGSTVLDMFAADLATPEVYTIMGEDTLNLSAWFDNVPDNMLAVWKNYFEGTDSSLAGFFPTKIINSDVDPNYVPVEFALKGNYPNPFNPLTTIAFDLPNDGLVNMSVFNITGRKVADLIDHNMQAGSYELTWNAADQASGVYIVRVQSGTQVAYQKMTLLK
jgi:type IX secretion system substrate protein